MAKVLVLYHSTYGHLETMAEAVAEGARAAGATVDIKRVPETVPEATPDPLTGVSVSQFGKPAVLMDQFTVPMPGFQMPMS